MRLTLHPFSQRIARPPGPSHVIDQSASEPTLHRNLYLLKFLRALVLHFVLLSVAVALHVYADVGGLYFTADGVMVAMDAAADRAALALPGSGAVLAYGFAALVIALWIGFPITIYLSVTNVWRKALRIGAVLLIGYGAFVLYSFWPAFQFSLAKLDPEFSGLLLLSVAFIELVTVDGALGLWRVSRSTESSSFLATLDPRLARGPWAYVNKLLDLPRTPLAGWRILLAYVLALAAAVLLVASLSQWINAGGAYGQVHAMAACNELGLRDACTAGASAWAYGTLVWLALALLGIKLSALLLAAAKRLGALSVSEVLKDRSHPFILYLRPFDADDVILPAPRLPWLSRTVSLRPFPVRVEDELFDVADGFRPLIAIGRPGDDDAKTRGGAYRTYVDDSEWRDYVLDAIERAETIVIMLKDTPGVRWELATILRQDALEKTLFLFEPAAREPGQWMTLARSALALFRDAGTPLSMDSFQSRPLAFAVAGGQLIEFHNAHWTTTSYRTAFSHFLSGRWREGCAADHADTAARPRAQSN